MRWFGCAAFAAGSVLYWAIVIGWGFTWSFWGGPTCKEINSGLYIAGSSILYLIAVVVLARRAR